jgi:hypothetical protein
MMKHLSGYNQTFRYSSLSNEKSPQAVTILKRLLLAGCHHAAGSFPIITVLLTPFF